VNQRGGGGISLRAALKHELRVTFSGQAISERDELALSGPTETLARIRPNSAVKSNKRERRGRRNRKVQTGATTKAATMTTETVDQKWRPLCAPCCVSRE